MTGERKGKQILKREFSPSSSFSFSRCFPFPLKVRIKMARCMDCANFNLKTHYCEWCNSYIKEKCALKSIPCDGFQKRSKNAKEATVEKHHRVPDFKLVRCK